MVDRSKFVFLPLVSSVCYQLFQRENNYFFLSIKSYVDFIVLVVKVGCGRFQRESCPSILYISFPYKLTLISLWCPPVNSLRQSWVSDKRLKLGAFKLISCHGFCIAVPVELMLRLPSIFYLSVQSGLG